MDSDGALKRRAARLNSVAGVSRPKVHFPVRAPLAQSTCRCAIARLALPTARV